MKDLIEALNILSKYVKSYYCSQYPTACEHDILYVCGIDFDKITLEEIHKLAKLGFLPGADEEVYIFKETNFENITQETWDNIKNRLTYCFRSYRFGSC